MNIGGYRNLTLQDYPGRVAAICFTNGCRLRCPYCHNAPLVIAQDRDPVKGEENLAVEFLEYLQKRKSQLDGVVVSGGEPMQQSGILEFLAAIQKMGLHVKLDTNGLYPLRLKEALGKGLIQYVAMDYKNARGKLARTVGLNRPEDYLLSNAYEENWKKSLDCLRTMKIPYELRTTVVQELHSVDDLIHMARSIHDGGSVPETWYLQRFIKTGPVINDTTQTEPTLTAYSQEKMETLKGALLPYAPGISLRSYE